MTTRSATPPDTASRVWTALHEFVTGQDRRRALNAALDLGPAKVELLIKLADGPMTLREIARAVEADPPAATAGVDKLEARGLVPGGPARWERNSCTSSCLSKTSKSPSSTRA
jgi:DNA-binding transcriptional ArsR family regulator